ncbi:MAG: 4Fe-4S binding protein [Candidatus Aenigmatarchaeota archaeon]
MVAETLQKGAIVKEAGSTENNKTGSWRTFRPVVTEKCIGCGICTWYCPEGAITVKDIKGKKKAVIDYDYCKGCLICLGECPQKAIISEKEK